MGSLALIPQYAIVPFLALLWGRRRAALGMAAAGGALALVSVAMVGVKGVERYCDMAEYFGRFEGTDTVTEWAMFNIRGLVTLEDILEEIVGEVTSDPGTLHKDIHRDTDGSYVVNGAINVRVLNRTLGWKLPTDGPRTLNGLILEYLENIPEPGTALKLCDLSIEILQAVDNAVRTARIRRVAEEDATSGAQTAQISQR